MLNLQSSALSTANTPRYVIPRFMAASRPALPGHKGLGVRFETLIEKGDLPPMFLFQSPPRVPGVVLLLWSGHSPHTPERVHVGMLIGQGDLPRNGFAATVRTRKANLPLLEFGHLDGDIFPRTYTSCDVALYSFV